LQTPGEPDIVTELIDLFLEDARKRITILRQAADRGDAKTIKDQAHAVKVRAATSAR
jgi:HPt (histidine-containing phosphotransfer) domain-containing protein